MNKPENPLSVAIAGIAGRMGRQLAAVSIDRGVRITGATEVAAANAYGEDIGLLAGRRAIGLHPVADAAGAAAGAGVWIDFTRPEATLAALKALASTSVRAAIIGTTGFTAAEEDAIAAASSRFAIVKAGNFSIGVNLLEALTRLAASRLGTEWDIEVLETHHRMKADAPSGTALMLGAAAAEGRGAPLSDLRAAPYDGPDAQRETGQIGFSVRRAGGVIGEHEVTFGSEKELIRLSHTALDRSVFAEGALHAAAWAVSQPPGLYDMNDVLGLGHTG
ncbi:dihydrodipicolinate reductase [Hyphomonas neptunium ATCC 15444]|uniref:4-hydroxy-tetrahydrodipicolinate reductase n=2 Tax=Hyphomonas TaxID=85 RepID=Q0C526_HYPNA|nr:MULTISPECIES: 4-hydroxy-tetrahydrodipicolinate reductase [Hyphomonas]ABI76525.1 dihydrodipicolinate reductase [Hyphomonas neptunium ATCC 15444]KCZ95600.1 dihydrodipicolinate reductase [Hyphomonas hirschiana VP5]